jgi:DNA-binding IclR family transcriptional regulator
MALKDAQTSRRSVGSVARAMALLDVLAASESGLGVNELSRRIGVNASTASRLLATLQASGLVARDADNGPYRLGLRLVTLADRVLAQQDVRTLARPMLVRLVDDTGETATLSLPGDEAAITIDFVPSPSSVVSMARVGRPSVPHATAAGKVMLAFAEGTPVAAERSGESDDVGLEAAARAVEAAEHDTPAGEHEQLPNDGEQLPGFTERTITDPVRLATELADVRRWGWAEAAGEREPDLAALAAPVFGRDGGLVAILGLQGPVARLPAEKRAALSEPLVEAAAELGAALGGSAAVAQREEGRVTGAAVAQRGEGRVTGAAVA